MKQKIYLLDDHPIVIEGLKQILNTQEDMEVVGSAEDANVGLQQIAKVKPDVLVMDLLLEIAAASNSLRK